jgi:uncharacterized membrane protein
MEADALVSEYLGRLEMAAQALPADRRGELIAEVHEHIESALAEAGNRDQVTARNVLERLGAPEEIVAAETGGERGAPAPTPQVVVVERHGWGATELGAILFLTVGAILLPIIGPIIGLVLTWASAQWTTGQKWIATLIVLILLVLPVVLLLGLRAGVGTSGAAI